MGSTDEKSIADSVASQFRSRLFGELGLKTGRFQLASLCNGDRHDRCEVPKRRNDFDTAAHGRTRFVKSPSGHFHQG